ncbi:MAG: 3'-5' exonuclease [Chitinophagales bacterium]
MLHNILIEKILFVDVETVSTAASYDELSQRMQSLWQKKHKNIARDEELSFSESYENNAGIYAEFGRIVCISCGFIHEGVLRIKSFYSHDERELLEGFRALLQANLNLQMLCGHNIKEFDVPYVCRRMLVNGVKLPYILDIAGKKPWEVNFIDTMQLWKFGDYKSYTSLDLLAALFDIPTPKDDIDGSMVGKVFWEENDLERIANYCQKDVVTVVRLFQKYRNEKMLAEEQIVFV